MSDPEIDDAAGDDAPGGSSAPSSPKGEGGGDEGGEDGEAAADGDGAAVEGVFSGDGVGNGGDDGGGYGGEEGSASAVDLAENVIREDDKSNDNGELGGNLLTAVVPRLDDLVVKCLAENYDIYPALDRIPVEYLDNVVALLDPSQIEFTVAAKYITSEKFWKRLSQERWPICQVACHGLSWKRLYIERHLQSLFEAYYPSKGRQNYNRLMREVNAGKAFVHSCTVQQLLSHLDLSDILGSFPNLSSLHLRYGARKLGMDYDKSLFGMQLKDAMSLSKLIVSTRFLSRLLLPENLLNDESIHILSSGLLSNETITYLDLSHNKISDAGAKRISRIIQNHGVLSHIDLGDNHVHTEGLQYLARALKPSDTIESFSIKLNPIGDRGGRDLFNALAENASMTELNASGCGLGAESGAALLSLLEANTALTSLDVSCNELNVQGMDLRDAIIRSTSLTTLDLRRCGVDDLALQEINAILAKRLAEVKQERRKEYQKGWDEAL